MLIRWSLGWNTPHSSFDYRCCDWYIVISHYFDIGCNNHMNTGPIEDATAPYCSHSACTAGLTSLLLLFQVMISLWIVGRCLMYAIKQQDQWAVFLARIQTQITEILTFISFHKNVLLCDIIVKILNLIRQKYEYHFITIVVLV